MNKLEEIQNKEKIWQVRTIRFVTGFLAGSIVVVIILLIKG